jgi:ABC-type multidrug transport system fused ATPase/permease subunit
MSEEPQPSGKSGETIADLLVIAIPAALLLVLLFAIGWVADFLVSPVDLAKGHETQQAWIEAVTNTSTLAVADTFYQEFVAASGGEPTNPEYYDPNRGDGNVLAAPFIALVLTVTRFFALGGLSAIVQLALGALCVFTIIFVTSKRQRIVFEHLYANIFALPILIVLAASLIGLVLQYLMLGALNVASSVTSFAAYAMGAGGVITIGWTCCVKLAGNTLEDVIKKRIGLSD